MFMDCPLHGTGFKEHKYILIVSVCNFRYYFGRPYINAKRLNDVRKSKNLSYTWLSQVQLASQFINIHRASTGICSQVIQQQLPYTQSSVSATRSFRRFAFIWSRSSSTLLWLIYFCSRLCTIPRANANNILPYSGKLWRALNLANQSSECIGKF